MGNFTGNLTGKLAPAILLAATAALGGCAINMPDKEIAALSEVQPGAVLVVGAVEVVPPLRPGEKELDIPNDIFGMEEMLSNRAWLTIGRSPATPIDEGEVTINPELGQTYYFAVPKDAPYMVGGYVMVDYQVIHTSSTTATSSDRRVVIPGTLRLDIRPDDEAIYVGTIRVKRDDFNEVIEATLVDDYQHAAADFKKRFGTQTRLRKAIFQTTASR
jgi:hypothetical protein